MLTGTYGYGYNENASFYTGNTFYNPGYPGEDPYDGERMYNWQGTFNSVPSNEVEINRYSYGGQSGSGAHYIDSSLNRYVYAVLSNGDDTTTDFPRITSWMYSDIGTFINEDTPSTYDLVPLNVKFSSSTQQAGTTLSSMSYVVENYSSQPVSGTFGVDVYISVNDNISTTDRLIQHHTFTYSFGAKSSVTITVTTPPTIPADLASGDYHIGIILGSADANTGNNDTDGFDAAAIHVTPAPIPPDVYEPNDGFAAHRIWAR